MIIHKVSKKGKSNLTYSYPEYKLVFKRGAVAAIKKAKGWKSDNKMAMALGITRAMLSGMKSQKLNVTHKIMTRLAYQLSNTRGNWWTHFEMVEWGHIPQNHPLYNHDKYMGRIPYTEHSPAAAFRSLDYEAESL